jgi:hypothetical protein
MVAFGVSLVAILLIVKFFSGVQMHFQRSWVDLQSFHEGQMAMASLRRDFAGACPLLEKTNGRTALKMALKHPVKGSGIANPLPSSQVIQVEKHQVVFHRFLFETDDSSPTPRVERVEYRFDPASSSLLRISGGNTRTFHGIRDLEFRLYSHELNPQLPVLWLRIVVLEGVSVGGSSPTTGSPLELTTSLQSTFLLDAHKHPSWNFDTYHQP